MKAKRLPPGAKEEDDIDDNDCDEEDDERDEAKKKTTSKISKNLSDLVNIISAVHFHSFDGKGMRTCLAVVRRPFFFRRAGAKV